MGFEPKWIQLDVGLIGSPPSSRQEFVHIETPFMGYKVISGSPELMSQNAKSLALAMFLSETGKKLLTARVILIETKPLLQKKPT